MFDSKIILINPEDNCLVSLQNIKLGDKLVIDGEIIQFQVKNGITNISMGHKIARRNIQCGEKIIRYGAVIGSATSDIDKGEYIHSHNLKSDYLVNK